MSIREKILTRIAESANPYQDRVNKAVDDVVSHYESGLHRDRNEKFNIDDKIDMYSQHSIDYKLGGKAKKDFLSDVKKGVKAKIGKRIGSEAAGKTRSANAQVSKAATDAMLDKIFMTVMTAVGDTFPDGDPIDHIHPKVIKMLNAAGFEDGYGSFNNYSNISDWLDKAMKKHGYKGGYHQYLADTWDEYMGDNPELKKQHPNNPWK
jgi:hypothetical protein